jgi:glycine/D-amino acid oxidase-like deaminating enzyme
MRPDVLVVGQGLAGTLLGWELEQAGIPFVVVDAGHDGAASTAAAGLINPVTGRRLVKSWRVDALLPLAREVYGAIGTAWEVPLWRELGVRRRWADERERTVHARKQASGELAPYAPEPADESGFWIRGAARVDPGVLLGAARARWLATGRLRPGRIDPREETDRHGWVIDCSGRAAAGRPGLDFVPWEFSRGEALTLAVEGLDPGEVRHCRHSLVPAAEGTAWIGATQEPGLSRLEPSRAARQELEESARTLLDGKEFAVLAQHVGVRVTLPDRRPIAGPVPGVSGLGICNGLGSKGVLWAPFLARQWIRHLAAGEAFDSEISIQRFAVK